jgi:hypothetical protein
MKTVKVLDALSPKCKRAAGESRSNLRAYISLKRIYVWPAISAHARIGQRFFQIPREDRSETFEVRRYHPQVIPGHSFDLELIG